MLGGQLGDDSPPNCAAAAMLGRLRGYAQVEKRIRWTGREPPSGRGHHANQRMAGVDLGTVADVQLGADPPDATHGQPPPGEACLGGLLAIARYTRGNCLLADLNRL